MSSDVLATTLTSTDTVVAGRNRLKGVYLVSSATAGSITFKDGGSGGTTRLVIATPAGVGDMFVPVPGDGIVFSTDIHATISNATSVTTFYG